MGREKGMWGWRLEEAGRERPAPRVGGEEMREVGQRTECGEGGFGQVQTALSGIPW